MATWVSFGSGPPPCVHHEGRTAQVGGSARATSSRARVGGTGSGRDPDRRRPLLRRRHRRTRKRVVRVPVLPADAADRRLQPRRAERLGRAVPLRGLPRELGRRRKRRSGDAARNRAAGRTRIAGRMTAVVSLFANPQTPGAAAEVIDAVSAQLSLDPHPGSDGSWEFVFAGTYSQAHSAVAGALASADPDWPAKLTLDYVLAV